MTAANWAALVPAVVGILVAGAAYLKSRTAVKTAKTTQQVITNHLTGETHNGN